jgi:dienelactone hydrolase
LSPRRDTLAARWARLAPHVQVMRPDGPGPHPVVLMFHGCGGRRPYLDGYMRAAQAAGVMSVAVDSFTPRRISRKRALATVCTGMELPGWRRAGDVLAALWGLPGIAGADPARVALAGWSHGGWAIMDLMTMALARPGEGGLADPTHAPLVAVKEVLLSHPYCGPGALTQLRPWRRAPDVLALVGEADRVAHPALCRRAFRQAERAGAHLETWFPEAATHAFDEDASGFSFFRYDAALAREAEQRMAAFLARAFATGS